MVTYRLFMLSLGLKMRENLNATLLNLILKLDEEPPHFTGCPLDQTINITSTSSTSNSDSEPWESPSAWDNSGYVVVSGNHDSKSSFTSGHKEVTYIATDPSGNSANCSFNVTIYGTCLP